MGGTGPCAPLVCALGWRELIGYILGRREHDGSRLRSAKQLQVFRRSSRIQMFEGACRAVGSRLRRRKLGVFRPG